MRADRAWAAADDAGAATPPAPAAGARTLGDWAHVVATRWPVVLAFTVAGLLTGLAWTAMQPTLYEARSTVVPSPATGVLDPDNGQDLNAVARTVAGIATADAVLQSTAQSFGARTGGQAPSLDEVRDRVSAQVPRDTGIVQITARADTQDEARALAASAVASLMTRVAGLGAQQPPPPGTADPDGGLRLGTLGEPVPQGRVSPTPWQNLVIGGAAGLLLGVIAAALLPTGRMRMRRPRDMATTLGSDVVALPRRARAGRDGDAGGAGRDGVYTIHPERPVDEAYRVLRARVAAAASRGESVVAVLGPAPAPGLLEVGMELGAQLAALGGPTVVVDAGFRSNGVAAPAPGLGEVLAGRSLDATLTYVPVELSTRRNGGPSQGSPRLALLHSGRPPADPAGATGSGAMEDVVSSLRTRFRHVILVGPPSARRAQSMAVAGQADATIMVMSSRTPADEARSVMGSEEATSRPVLAVGALGNARSR